MTRSSSAQTGGSRRYSRDQRAQPNYEEYPVPPVPVDYGSSTIPQDFTTPPLTGSARLNSPPEEPLPRDFDPNDSRSHYAMGYRSDYGTPPQQARHETQYTPSNPRQTRQRSLSGGARTGGPHVRRMSAVPIVPQVPSSLDQDSSGYGGGYDGEKASTVDLVERDSYERRESEVKRGGPTVSKGQVPFEDMGDFFQEVRRLSSLLPFSPLLVLTFFLLSFPSYSSSTPSDLRPSTSHPRR
jgi:hypothetical protein